MNDSVEQVKKTERKAKQNRAAIAAIREHGFAMRVLHGQIVATPGAMELCYGGDDPERMIAFYLHRYVTGRWDEQDQCDADQNVAAIGSGDRLLMSFEVAETGQSIWIITDAAHDVRAVTTILLPEEY